MTTHRTALYKVGDIVKENDLKSFKSNHYLITAIQENSDPLGGDSWTDYSALCLETGVTIHPDNFYFDRDTHKVA